MTSTNLRIAYFLARSAVNISKLLLAFQFALSSESKATQVRRAQIVEEVAKP